ncbi:hypothetical protein ACFL34_03695 [Candidatus Sumerlaeota bacterium]
MPTIFEIRSRSKPSITAITMISAVTPTATPPTEINVISESKPERSRVNRYRMEMKVSTRNAANRLESKSC